MGKGSKMPSPLLCCLGGHQGLKSMHPINFLGCNSRTLPFTFLFLAYPWRILVLQLGMEPLPLACRAQS